MIWAEIHLQPDQHVFDRNNVHKSAMILHNFGSGSIFIFIKITARLNSLKCNVIQLIKMWPNDHTTADLSVSKIKFRLTNGRP